MLLSSYTGYLTEAGCDEAGRGCLAGPVFAAAVILPVRFRCERLKDSKQLTEKERIRLREMILQKALAWAVDSVDNETIDEINILNASILAMHKALDKLSLRPELILVDGNKFHPYHELPYRCIIKGDSTYQSIAAASILAKTFRDEYMAGIDSMYPLYGWKNNKGYPTARHRDSVRKYGLTPFHRKSFRIHEQLTLGL